MRGKFIYPRSEIERIRQSVDAKTTNFNLIPRNKKLKHRLDAKKQAAIDDAKHQKRVKFRGLAHRFLEWRAERTPST